MSKPHHAEAAKHTKGAGATADDSQKANKTNQIIGAIAVTLNGMTVGTVTGWASPAHDILTDDGITDAEFAHIGSIMCLGAAVAQPFMIIYLQLLGKKWSLVTASFPLIGIWIMLAFVNNFYAFLVGRFFIGFCAGAYCVAAPSYIGEYAEKKIRGTLGIMYQLLLVTGILFAYSSGLFDNRYLLSLPMIGPPAIGCAMMIFLPESPVDLLVKKKTEKARAALQFYRGKDYDVTQEIKELESYTKSGQGTFKEHMQDKAVINGFLTLLIMHVAQQLCGINTILFYAGEIVKGGCFFGLKSNECVCLIATIKIVMTIIVALIVDKIGRKILWIISLTIMAISSILIGVYFFIKHKNEDLSKKIEWLLFLLIAIYIIGFNFGAGSLPWSMIGELLSSGTKAIGGTIITAVNWLLAYGVTVSFPFLETAVGIYTIFIVYGVICAAILPFIIFVLIETKGKTLDDIQKELSEMKWCKRK